MFLQKTKDNFKITLYSVGLYEFFTACVKVKISEELTGTIGCYQVMLVQQRSVNGYSFLVTERGETSIIIKLNGLSWVYRSDEGHLYT